MVTGGSRGIGRAIAEAFLAEGARVAVLHSDLEDDPRLAWMRQADPGRLLPICADVCSPEQITEAFRRVADRWGTLDILVNNAGATNRLPFAEMADSDWEQMQHLNLDSVFHCTRAALVPMQRAGAGTVINISSIRAHRGFASDSGYIAAKGGMEALSRALAVELAPLQIRVNCIAPGAIATDFNRTRLEDPELRQQALGSIPLARLGRPADLAGAALFLASSWSSFITGITLPVDGGQLIKG